MKKVEIYYLRNNVKMNTCKGEKEMNVPFATVAVEINDDNTVNRGVAICSDLDNFNKKKGRNLAMARLEYAKNNKSCFFGIKDYRGKKEKSKCPEVPFHCLASYKDMPNEHEKKLFELFIK
jgi:hypothetical protein